MTLSSSNKFLLLLLVSIYAAGCAKNSFEPIENNSNKIEKSCLSVIPPKDGKWYVDNGFLAGTPGTTPCSSQIRLLSGGGNDIYHIYIRGERFNWKDDTTIENLLNEVSKMDFTKDIDYAKVNLIHRDVEICEYARDLCVKAYYEYSSDRQLMKLDTGDTVINPSERYYYQIVYYDVKISLGHRNGFEFVFTYTHESTNNNLDPELQSKALSVLKTIEFTKAGKFKNEDK